MNLKSLRNIKTTVQSFNVLSNKKKRSRKWRHATFLKQQKRSLIKTLKQDKIYRQDLENFHDQMFNSTITRSSEKIKNKSKCSSEVHNNNTHVDDTGFQTNSNTSPLQNATNVRIVISKVVVESTKSIDPLHDVPSESLNLSEWLLTVPQCSVPLHDLHSSSITVNEMDSSTISNPPSASTEESMNMEDLEAEKFATDEMNDSDIPKPSTTIMVEFMKCKDFDAEKFFQLTRVSKSLFDDLSEFVSSKECLAMTLNYLAEGVNLDILSQQFGVSESAAQRIILTTSKQLLHGIKDKVLAPHFSYTDFYETALQYQDECDLPNCVGALGSRYVTSSNSLFPNEIAIDILAACRPNFQFTSVEIFLQNNPHDRRDILNKSKLMTKSIANIPTMQLPNSSTFCQGFFVAPKSFPNTINIITQSTNISSEINRRLRRAVNVIDIAFALLSKNWKCFDRHDLAVTTATKIDITTVWVMICLHNYILMNADGWLRQQYCPADYIDQFDVDGNMTRGKWRRDLHQGKIIKKMAMTSVRVNRGSKEQESHLQYFDYILNEGRVQWQERP